MRSNRASDRGAQPRPRVVAVVVTYNRLGLLEKTLSGIASGSSVPERVVLVDNASTDGTAAFLRDLDYPLPLDVVRLGENLGGAGGFTAGIDRALHAHGADLVWVMDDDTEPLEQTLEASLAAWEGYAADPADRPAFVASRVVWSDGREHPMNSMIERIGAGSRRRRLAAAVGARSVRSGSFVSLLMDGAAMRRAGLPHADYFIWNDDFEYSTRLARHADALEVPGSVVAHHTKTFGTTDAAPGPRFYYDVRNKLWVFTRSRSLAPWEKVLYGGATARLWWRTVRRNGLTPQLRDCLLRGVRDALRPPRPNDVVLAGSYDLAAHGVPGEVPAGGAAADAGEPPAFSLLMPVYSRDRPGQLRAALASSTWEQTLPPAEAVLVLDGPVGPELDAEIASLEDEAAGRGLPLTVLRLPEHRGLPAALNAGLERCTLPIVARADADDVSLPSRFARQIPLVADGFLDVLGSAMYEAGEDLGTVQAVRRVETEPARIRSIARGRNPLCHPSVVFRADAVREVGGYQEVPGAEDYDLWIRMMRAGHRIGNIAEPLVIYRAGSGAWRRRGGLGALRRELSLQRHLRETGFVSRPRWARNVLVRGLYRLVPTAGRIEAYRRLVGSRGAGAAGPGVPEPPGPGRASGAGEDRA
ncbi:glycosyltransferase [Rothia sp. AR01]|uniref:Glycosyltransferase n=1 Tax=Rothia santali TaxID=2949643 RepID=A0A9X2HKJ0_9MICC|nr:glycosyltransferase [Rothia santali]MCP3425953.1 glycosyltransferase [Rothia santali]